MPHADSCQANESILDISVQEAAQLIVAAAVHAAEDIDDVRPHDCMRTGGERRMQEWTGAEAMSGAGGVLVGDSEESLVFTVGESLHATSSRVDGEIAKKGASLLQTTNESH